MWIMKVVANEERSLHIYIPSIQPHIGCARRDNTSEMNTLSRFDPVALAEHVV